MEETLTLKAVVLYILKNGKTRASHTVYYIVKTAFVAQQKHLAKYLCPLFEDNIMALQFGPVPSNIYDALKIARGDAKTMNFHTNDDLPSLLQLKYLFPALFVSFPVETSQIELKRGAGLPVGVLK